MCRCAYESVEPSMMMLAAEKGTAVTVHTEGDDAVATLEAVAELINDRFGEDE